MKDLKHAAQFTNEDFVSLQPDASITDLKTAVEYSDQQFMPLDADPSDARTKPAAKSTVSGWLATGLALVLLLGGMQWAEFVQVSLNQSWLQGGAALALTGLVFAATVKLSVSFWLDRRRRRERQLWREQAEIIRQDLQYGQAVPLCHRIIKALPDCAKAADFWALHHVQLSDAETLQLFDLQMLQPLDQEANARISAAAKQIGVAVAVSPFALADMLLVSWRAWRLMAELSSLYGVSLGVIERMALMKQFANLLFWSGATELAIDIGGDFLGVELSSKLSARAGQGVLAGLMLARLGRFVQQQLRPLPMHTKQSQVQPLLQSLVKRLLERPPAQ